MLFSWKGLKGRIRAVLHLDDAPWRIALGLAVGVFISCTPFYGFHTLMAIVVALLFRLNKVATITGSWFNLPWFAPFVYAVSLKVGEFILSGGRGLEVVRGKGPGELAEMIRPLLSLDKLKAGFLASSKLLFIVSTPLVVGTTLVGLVAAVVTYFLTLAAIKEIRHLAHLDKGPPPRPPKEPR